MPGEDIQSWSTTAANNGTADTSINWAEGQPRASVNNSARSMMAAHAKDRNLHNGTIVTSGAANAQAFTSGVGYIAPIPTGLLARLKIGPSLTNTGAATLNMDGIADTPVKDQLGNDLTGGELVAGSYADFVYDGTNWVLLTGVRTGQIIGVQIFTVTGTYTRSTGCKTVIAEAIGGGGGGGGVTAIGVGQIACSQGGGGAGYAMRRVSPGATEAVTVGLGGAGGAVGNGFAGGTSSFGTWIAASGGGGGGGGAGAAIFSQAGALGGFAIGGDVNLRGGSSHPCWGSFPASLVIGSQGGTAARGGAGGLALVAPAPGNDGLSFGGGGGGCVGFSGSAGFNGGAGFQGVVIVTEYR